MEAMNAGRKTKIATMETIAETMETTAAIMEIIKVNLIHQL